MHAHAVLQDELLLNEHLVSSKALSQHLVHLLQQQDSQDTGSIPLPQLVHTLHTLSQDSLGLGFTGLACIIGHAAADAAETVAYERWVPAAAEMMYSMLEPGTASIRHAAMKEFKAHDESERSRSASIESVKVNSGVMFALCMDRIVAKYLPMVHLP